MKRGGILKDGDIEKYVGYCGKYTNERKCGKYQMSDKGMQVSDVVPLRH